MPGSATPDVTFRKPTKNDGAAIWTLVRNSGVLELNSAYCYVMMCHYFSDTVVIAQEESEIAGFVLAYHLPAKPDGVFVWQVAVAPLWRGKGLATQMLKALLRRNVCKNVRFIESTVTPSNRPSELLFKGLARDLKTSCEVSECFPARLFPQSGHEEERLFRIGPFDRQCVLGK